MTNIVVRVILATLCIPIGVAGLVLPILPGWIFFAVAALLLFPDTRLARRTTAKIEQHFPSTKRLLRFLLRDR